MLIGELKMTETQKELVEKFDSAFYEAQEFSKTTTENVDDILETFDETYFTNIENYDETSDEHLLDYLLPKSDDGFSELTTPASDCASTFDYDEFSENFEQFNRQAEQENCTFFIPPPEFDSQEVYDDDLDIENLNIYFYNPDTEQEQRLPPVNTLVKNNMDFSTYIRSTEHDSLNPGENTSDFGHLLGFDNLNNNISDSDYLEETTSDTYSSFECNQIILTQSESLLTEHFTKRERHVSETSTDCEEITTGNLQCKWAECYQVYNTQNTLVRHIEKVHVELKRGDEFTCYWINCPRKNKPFNARYKLLIHMRVHSGEKPNKCPFRGCNKAFSRLENLKIHQRSHTGERPYLCQFPHCSKSFSNSSDRAKHQRTHYDTKPYGCQVFGCLKKYTDPSSLRKHVKNHTPEEQMQLKTRALEARITTEVTTTKKLVARRGLILPSITTTRSNFYASLDHSYSNGRTGSSSSNVKQDLKLRLSERISNKGLML